VSPDPRREWRAPWRRELTAFGDPPVSGADTLANDRWQPLPASAGEVRGIARILSGRAEIHLGADARKLYLLDHRAAGVPLIHFSTHALVDGENPDRSRILLAADSPAAGFVYLFQEEVYNLDLHGCSLVTVSACDTARGKLIRGEGVQAFSHAFLAAGAQATVTSLWRVPDQPTADFMQQLYYFLERGQSKAQALRSAKMQFLSGNFGATHPRYWAAFILTGDGWNPCPRTVGWSPILGIAAGLLALAALAGRFMAGRTPA
jgi:CHAT domain-containing protein